MFELKLTFDDVCLVPQYNNVESRTEPSVETVFARKMYEKEGIKMKIPFLASNMDTVIGEELARIIIQNGGFPIFHRFTTVEQQIEWANKYKNKCAISAGVTDKEVEKIKGIMKEVGHKIFCIDIAHAHAKYVMNIMDDLYETDNEIVMIVGNIATTDAYHDLANHHAALIKIQIGPGSICTTPVVTGHGYPTFSCVWEIGQKAKKLGIPIVSDGGIRIPGDVAKAIGAGASSVMMGSVFVKTFESAAPKFVKFADHKKIDPDTPIKEIDPDYNGGEYIAIGRKDALAFHKKGYKVFARYRGQASRLFQQDFYGEVKKGTTPEGIDYYTEVNRSAQDVLDEYIGGLKSAMTYSGSRTLSEFRRKAQFIRVTPNYVHQAHPRTHQ